ncbi:MAG: 4-alpha-glucanotransferase, partial [Candidatus Marinimicrobia bacterium]|nr:4-alpha-glucanotransferase [Candidatus Neomarinimicrobiota bacterium]
MNIKKYNRSSGILLHPTSLPGMWDMGDFGKSAFAFIDFLNSTNQKLWQILPLTIPDNVDSPYASSSAFAGNTVLISPEELEKYNLVSKKDILELESKFTSNANRKEKLFKIAFKNYEKKNILIDEYEEFKEKESYWLEYTVIFLLLKEEFNNVSWKNFPEEFKSYKNISNVWKEKNRNKLEKIKFKQFLFYYQWENIRKYSQSKNVEIIG